MQTDLPLSGRGDDYLIGPRQAWFAFAMTIALMVFDYLDRQIIVSLFPHLKAEWGLSDTQLGALVSAVSVTVAIAGIPVALFADRVSRVGSIVAMGTVARMRVFPGARGSMPCMCPRRPLRSPTTSPTASSGTSTSTWSTGSRIVAPAASAAARNAIAPAILNAASLESTS